MGSTDHTFTVSIFRVEVTGVRNRVVGKWSFRPKEGEEMNLLNGPLSGHI
jgi:hypothetical protein